MNTLDQRQLVDVMIAPFANNNSERYISKFVSPAIWSLGRISCVNHVQAERVVPFFGGQLQSTTSSNEAKVAALGALADLCRVKTQLVDKFIDIIATMLYERSLYVAKKALKLLTYMLRRDFVKMRPSLLSRMLILARVELLF